MQYDPERWHDFATSFAGAAGALLGLAFVAISFNLDAILRDKTKTLPGRAIETLVFFAYPLAASLLIQVPGLSNTALGVGEAILAAGLVGLVARIDVPRWRRNERSAQLAFQPPRASRRDRLTGNRGGRGYDDDQFRWPLLAGRRHGRCYRDGNHQQLGLCSSRSSADPRHGPDRSARILAGLRSGDGPLSVRVRPSSLKHDHNRRTNNTDGKCRVNLHP